jgi:flagellar biosynthesis protein FlhA
MSSPASLAGPSRASLTSQLWMPLGLLVVVGTILLPLPPLAMDALLTLNLAAAMVLTLTVLFADASLAFTAFPSVLLFATVFRLSLNIASTRLILASGGNGTAAAGSVIEALGIVVVGGNFVVGLILFAVIIVIQYVVINHGAVRISEVSARFVLDAMPGKQMSIDADLNAGLIDEKTARERRERVAREAEFYGAMDGAVRFTQRDAVAGLVIVVINIVGGLVVGIGQLGMSLGDAFRTFTILTVGDGLANAIPSLLVSVAAALITTRASAESQVTSDLEAQLLRNPAPLYAAGALLAFFGLMPGLPHLPFLALGVALILVGRRSAGRLRTERERPQTGEAQAALKAAPEPVEKLVTVEKLAIELGFELLPLVGHGESGLPPRLKALRRELASSLGLVLPTVRITDNPKAQPNGYTILLKGSAVARGELMMGHSLVVDSGLGHRLPVGVETRDPAFNLPAVWVRDNQRGAAEADGHMVVDPLTVLVTHFAETVKSHAPELLGRQETKALLDVVAETHPKVVEELTPKLLTVGEVQKVLAGLLRERVPIRDLVTILETLADAAPASRAVPHLVAEARLALRRTVVAPYLTESGELHALTVSPQLEAALGRAAAPAAEPAEAGVGPADLIRRIQAALGAQAAPQNPVLLTSPPLRAVVRAHVEPYLPALPVLSLAELPPGVRVVSLGMVK